MERLRSEVPKPVRVEREETPVMFMRASEDTPEEISKAWAEFEEMVGLKGRKFFGSFDPVAKEYRVCTQLREEDDPEALGLEEGTLPGGSYLRVRLTTRRLRTDTANLG